MAKTRSANKRTPPSHKQDDDTVSLLPSQRKKLKPSVDTENASFVGKSIPIDEAQFKWPRRYSEKDGSEENDCLKAKFHYSEASVDGVIYKLNDTAYVKAEDDKPNYIARIVEFFETEDKEQYFTAQWFYRAEDTVITDIKIPEESEDHIDKKRKKRNLIDKNKKRDLIDKKRVFISDIKDENPLDCLVRKVKIAQLSLDVDLDAKKKKMPPCELYYDMKYTVPYLTFSNIADETSNTESDMSTISSDAENNVVDGGSVQNKDSEKTEWTLLDLYAGCGAMSTGLCFGASISGIKLVTRWAVDINEHACESLKLNHPETHVRNEPAEDFLTLLKEWAKLYKEFVLNGSENSDSNLDSDDKAADDEATDMKDEAVDANDEATDDSSDSEEFEVERLLAVCYGNPNSDENRGLYFKVQWKGYDSSYDTWEPIEGLRDCKDALKDFVTNGFKEKLLPLPGQADFICGGPPCQGISGFNRYRNDNEPLEDVRNKQLLVYMGIIDFLKPKYVLMENVVDLLKFSGGFLGRYAIGRLVAMNYQARMGMMAAGSYGLPQFRMRVFLWGALPNEKLPAYPLPTHDVVSRSVVPTEFEGITVAYPPEEKHQLADAVLLKDAIEDLPAITNHENQDERRYGTKPRTEFQKYIRLKRSEMVNFSANSQSAPSGKLYDHRPFQLNKDDYERVCQVPKKKGANFRDLPGVLVNGNKVEWDPSVERVLLQSGKPLVPDYAMSFGGGKSSKPFRRLWWDEIVNTVVTRAEPHNQAILHPQQDRVLSIRENARLQGFPDCYKLCGPIKERYMQVGNAVAVPVALGLGYTLGLAIQGLSDDKPLSTLPFKYPNSLALSNLAKVEDNDSS